MPLAQVAARCVQPVAGMPACAVTLARADPLPNQAAVIFVAEVSISSKPLKSEKSVWLLAMNRGLPTWLAPLRLTQHSTVMAARDGLYAVVMPLAGLAVNTAELFPETAWPG